ncbi:MAG: amidohydrolase family protein, partial [Caldilineaceae bacterium]|nr:amidohydrolase family protein [Caldilineaceae bacterium]
MAASADLLISNARVFTADPSNPWAEAVAVQGNRIIFVGSGADARAFAAPHTEVVDAAGRTLLPGFIDTHYHLLWGSLGLAAAQLG